MIQFNCPNCQRLLETPDGTTGAKFACPVCAQRIEVPAPPAGSKTVMGTLPEDPTPFTSEPLTPYAKYEEPIPYEEPRRERRRRRDEDDDYDDEDDDRGRRRGKRRRSLRSRREEGFQCPFCGTDEFPRVTKEISTGGWVVFAVLIFFCIPLCWIGLLITEEKRVCRDCGMKLG